MPFCTKEVLASLGATTVTRDVGTHHAYSEHMSFYHILYCMESECLTQKDTSKTKTCSTTQRRLHTHTNSSNSKMSPNNNKHSMHKNHFKLHSNTRIHLVVYRVYNVHAGTKFNLKQFIVVAN